MIKKVIIIGCIGTLILVGATVFGLMVYAPKNSQAFVPTMEIEPAKEAAKKGTKSRYETLKDAKFNKPETVEKRIAPVFEINAILTKDSIANSGGTTIANDNNALISKDTTAMYEAIIKRNRSKRGVKPGKEKRVGEQKKKYAAKTVKKQQKPISKKRKEKEALNPLSHPDQEKAILENVPVNNYMADKVEKEELKELSNKEKKYNFNYISSGSEQVQQGDLVRAELNQKLKIRSGRNGIELKLLEACTIAGRSYIQGDIMHGYSRLSGDRVQINISTISSNETGETEFVSLEVYDNDFQKGLAYDGTANNQKKRIIRNTSRDLIPNRIPGANTARGIVDAIAGTANGKFAKGYQVRVAIGGHLNNYSYNNNSN